MICIAEPSRLGLGARARAGMSKLLRRSSSHVALPYLRRTSVHRTGHTRVRSSSDERLYTRNVCLFLYAITTVRVQYRWLKYFLGDEISERRITGCLEI